MEIVESAARNVLAASSEGDALRTNLAVLKRFTKFEPVNADRRAPPDRRAPARCRPLSRLSEDLVITVGLPGSGKSTYLARLGV